MKKQNTPPYPDVHEVFNIPRVEMMSTSAVANAALTDIHKSLRAMRSCYLAEDEFLSYVNSRLSDIEYELGYIESYIEEASEFVRVADSVIQKVTSILGDRLTEDEERELQKLRMCHVLIRGNKP